MAIIPSRYNIYNWRIHLDGVLIIADFVVLTVVPTCSGPYQVQHASWTKSLGHVSSLIFIHLNKIHHEFELIVVTLIFLFTYFIFLTLQPFSIFLHNVFHRLMKNFLGQKLLHHSFSNRVHILWMIKENYQFKYRGTKWKME